MADIWANAGDRTKVSAAADAIDKALREDPYRHAHPLTSEGFYGLTVSPLRVVFLIFDDDCQVVVESVRRV